MALVVAGVRHVDLRNCFGVWEKKGEWRTIVMMKVVRSRTLESLLNFTKSIWTVARRDLDARPSFRARRVREKWCRAVSIDDSL